MTAWPWVYLTLAAEATPRPPGSWSSSRAGSLRCWRTWRRGLSCRGLAMSSDDYRFQMAPQEAVEGPQDAREAVSGIPGGSALLGAVRTQIAAPPYLYDPEPGP